jgi:hypothetical protein
VQPPAPRAPQHTARARRNTPLARAATHRSRSKAAIGAAAAAGQKRCPRTFLFPGSPPTHTPARPRTRPHKNEPPLCAAAETEHNGPQVVFLGFMSFREKKVKTKSIFHFLI